MTNKTQTPPAVHKNDALTAITALMAQHRISIEDIQNALDSKKDTPINKKDQIGIIKQLLGYTGGIFIFAGICLLAGMIWEDMTSLQRVIITLGTGLVSYVLGYMTAKDERYEKAATPLFLIAATMQIGGLFVFLNEYIPPSDNAELAVVGIFGIVGMQMGLTFKDLNRSSLLFLTLACAQIAFGTFMEWLELDETLIFFTVGLSILLITYAIGKTIHHIITPFWYFIGAAFMLWAYWDFVEGTPLDLSYLALNGFMIYASIQAASRSLLFVSVLGLLSYLGYFTAEYFADITGWPIALIIMGLCMVGISAYAVKAGQSIGKTT